MPENERESLKDWVYEILRNSAKLYIFGNNSPEVALGEWVDLLFLQGRMRLDEFSSVVSGKVPANTEPAEYPAAIQQIFDLFEESGAAIKENLESHTIVRLKLINLGEALKKRKDTSLAGSRLLDLVDKQTFYATLSWAELIDKSKAIIEDAMVLFIKSAERYRWKPQPVGMAPKNTDEET